ncbi:MAG: AhpC/TSA family protein [Myxococcales bacterium]|nr:AhpC/TSA family protein [Myxococcales bacterium]
MPRMRAGETIETVELETIQGQRLVLPSREHALVHLQFRRFAGCPICNLHLRSVAKRRHELVAAGIREVAFFHSTAESMRPFQGDLPFDVVADPDKTLYRRFGVEASLKSVADPRAWGGFLRGALASHASSSTAGEGGHLGLPADFLIDRAGRVLACKYGTHADDQWSVDEILAHARAGAAA